MKKLLYMKQFIISLTLVSFLFFNPLFGLNENANAELNAAKEESLSECLFESDQGQNNDIILFPKSSGDFVMGYKNIELIDTSRNDPYHAGKRRLKITLYYPSTASSAYLEPYGEEETLFWHRELTAVPSLKEHFNVIMNEFRTLRIHKALNAEPLPGKYPVIVFNHGFGVTAGSYQSLFQELVSHGYIICAIHNPYIADTVIFQNEDKLFRKAQKDETAVNTCIDDATFVLSFLPEIEYFHEVMDLDKIGILGHSLGGITSMVIARTNAQIKSVVSLDAPIEDLAAYEDGSKGFDKPFLHLFANKDSYSKTSLKVNNFKAFIVDTEHNSFADHEVLEKIIPFFKEESELDFSKYHTITALIRLFFDQFLKNDHENPIMSFNNRDVLLETVKE